MNKRYVALCAAAVRTAVAVQGVSGTAVAQAQTPAAAPAAPAAGSAVFPSSIDPKYAKETPGKARRQTCLDQYRANKKSNANGGLEWLAHNGYWSQCDKKLKGS
jgi:hypothetical protein